MYPSKRELCRGSLTDFAAMFTVSSGLSAEAPRPPRSNDRLFEALTMFTSQHYDLIAPANSVIGPRAAFYAANSEMKCAVHGPALPRVLRDTPYLRKVADDAACETLGLLWLNSVRAGGSVPPSPHEPPHYVADMPTSNPLLLRCCHVALRGGSNITSAQSLTPISSSKNSGQ